MGTVTEPGFHGGRFRQGGQFTEVDTPSAAGPDLNALTRDELVALARDRGVQHPSNATEAEIIAALTAGS